MMFLRQSTASQIVMLGPFVDSTDGVTAETGLTIANTDIRIKKHSSATFSDKNSGGATHVEDGYYQATLDATDTNTVGRLLVQIVASGATPVWHEYTVLPPQVYDSLMAGTNNLQVGVTVVPQSVYTSTPNGDATDISFT